MSTKLTLNGVEKPHGRNGYSNLGCRCRECKDAQSAYMRELRRVRAERLAADPSLAEHGTDDTYTNSYCRCRPCRDARAERRRAKSEATS